MVSGVALLLLARLRFPEPLSTVDSTQPLERLAARASFEELAIRVQRLEESIADHLIVLRLSPRADPPPRRLRDAIAELETGPREVRHVPALRIDSTTALAVIPSSLRISGIVRPVDSAVTAGITAADPLRHLARVRVPNGASRSLPHLSLSSVQTPIYVVAVEGTQAGVTLRPVFLGRSGRFTSARWTQPLLPLGGAVVTSGALIFTLDGQFIGCAVEEGGMPAIVDAADVLATVERVERAVGPVDAGIAVQRLTEAVSLATGATRGVVVAHVTDGSPASGVLEPGDVITAVGGEAFEDPESLLLRLGTHLVTGSARISFIRRRVARETELHARAQARTESPPEDGALVMHGVAGTGTRIVALKQPSPLAAAGVVADDLIVRAGSVVAPTPSQLRQEVERTLAGESLLLVVRRGDTHRVTAVRGDSGDVAAR